MYCVTWLLDWTRLFGGTKSREVIDEFARWTADEVDYLVEARQAVLLHEHAQRRPVRANRPRLPRLHDVARADDRAHRGHPAGRDHGRQARRRPGVPRRGSRQSGHDLDRIVPPPRLEHAQPGVRVRLLPRRPAPGQHLRARRATRSATSTSASSASSPTASASRSRATAGCCSGARSRPPSRELMRWLAPGPATDVDDAQLAADPRPPGVPVRRDRRPVARDRARPRGRSPESRENPYSKLAVDILETIRVQQLTMSPSIVG